MQRNYDGKKLTFLRRTLLILPYFFRRSFDGQKNDVDKDQRTFDNQKNDVVLKYISDVISTEGNLTRLERLYVNVP